MGEVKGSSSAGESLFGPDDGEDAPFERVKRQALNQHSTEEDAF